jgi:NADH-quinone oxidoreductase subunit I
MCEEACPVDAIELTPHYEVTGLSRNELIFDKTKLLHEFATRRMGSYFGTLNKAIFGR